MTTRKNPVKDRNQPDAPAQTIAVAPDLNMYIEPQQTSLWERIAAKLAHGENVIFTAPPGYGKTSMAKRIAFNLTEKHHEYQVCFMDLLSIRSRDSFLRLLRNEVLKFAKPGEFAEFIANSSENNLLFPVES